MLGRRLNAVAFVACFLLVAETATAQQPASAPVPLHVRIDRATAAAHIGPVAPVAGDAEFLRRIYLDLTGMIPSSAEARAFLADQSPDKRTKLVDRLLGSPAYVRHIAAAFDLMLMERRGDKHVKSPEWKQYLQTSFAANKPYNQLAAEILGADGADPKLRAPAKFFLDRDVEPNLATREVGRMFFGVDLECAQCHDHPNIDDYLQADYYGLYAFVSRTYVFQPDKKKPAVLAEKAEGDVKFKSVFTGFEGITRPRLLGASEIDEPSFKKGEDYQVKADPKKKNIRPIPKYSRRAQLAKRATDGRSPAFNRNIANRLWAHMMGRGLVHPADLHSAGNPPSNPQLMQALADEFVAMKFDVKAFIRELALSQTYQRSFEMPANLDEHVAIARKQLPLAKAAATRQLAVAVAAEKAVNKVLPKVEENKKTVAAATAELTKANAAVTATQTAATAAAKAQADVEQMLTPKQQVAKSLTEANEKIQAALKALPNDKELAAVAAKFVAKTKSTTAEVAALTKTLGERKTANAAAQQKLVAAQQLAAKSNGTVDAAKKQLAVLTAQHAAAAAALVTATRYLDAADKRESHTRLLTSYGDAQTKLAATNAVIGKASTEIANAQADLKKIAANMAKDQAELPAMQKADAAAVAALTKANADFVGKPDVAKLLSESLAKAEAAGQKLPNDADLKLAIGKLKERSLKLNQDVAEYRKAITVQTAGRKAAAEKLATLTQSIATATAAAADMKKQAAALETQRKQAAAKVEAERATAESAVDSLTDQWSTHFAVTPIEALTPEQIAWSVLRSTGQYDRQHAASAAEINKKTPMTDADLKDATKVAAREAAIEAAAVGKLQGNVNQFVKLFGAGAGQPQHEFFATVDQSLFFANGGPVRGWLSPGGGNLTDRLIKTEAPEAVAEELYLSLLTRQPTAEETADVVAYLAAKKDKKNEAVQELAWALLTSTEFRFNH
ncbi:MAG: DUF1549 domain-containing protein [Planctomycetaceae bacterium]|nr:DUF1549 domain-containing protein [Planctomycetaceae bacterium]MBT6485065.1 DUF1549 domain-containing protein [Planctomycetaceae bacterium]